MKKIDFHIHTVSTISDSEFSFSLEKMKEYIDVVKLDAIAITNHDVFDKEQFDVINRNLSIKVFPGIEINLENGHLLLITDENVLDFSSKCEEVSKTIQNIGDCLRVDELKQIFGDLNKYLLIPHYEKHPELNEETIKNLKEHIVAGEVNSPKKFIRACKDDDKLTPLYFSDIRISENLENFPTRQTFIDCGEITLNSIKICLRDKNKVSLSEENGNKLFHIFDNGQKLSSGLNVILGERSSGKTFTLDRINKEHGDAKYIKQFSLVQQDDGEDEVKFNEYLNNQRSLITDEFLREFKMVLNDVINIDLEKSEKALTQYLDTLLKSATEAEKKDVFSKTALFDEVEFKKIETKTLIELINAVRMLIENLAYKDVIEKHVNKENLKRLALELIETLWAKTYDGKKQKFVNELVREIKKKLKLQTSATQIKEFDFYKYEIDKRKVLKFSGIVRNIQKPSTIREESVQGFKIIAQKRQFTGSGEIKKVSGLRTAFREAFEKYNFPYEYLQELKNHESLAESEFYKYFVKIEYKILNKDGAEASGGERSEFRLLQQINDAQNYEILLIDEPESSFDNIFLRTDVNQIIKNISRQMPVAVVTHNNTVGASIKSDYLIYTSKVRNGNNVEYKVYSGYPTDKKLISIEGDEIPNFEITINSLEAGNDAYEERKRNYENLKN